jgi:hypothetical protein
MLLKFKDYFNSKINHLLNFEITNRLPMTLCLNLLRLGYECNEIFKKLFYGFQNYHKHS